MLPQEIKREEEEHLKPLRNIDSYTNNSISKKSTNTTIEYAGYRKNDSRVHNTTLNNTRDHSKSRISNSTNTTAATHAK